LINIEGTLKHISLLGSTGSIGTQTLDIAESHRDSISIVALAAGSKNLDLLAKQIKQFRPELVSVPTKADIDSLREKLGADCKNTEIVCGDQGLIEVATWLLGAKTHSCSHSQGQDDRSREQRNSRRSRRCNHADGAPV
jgi:hypothetical protein